MRADSIVISRPCPVDLDALGVDRSGRDFHCPHCDKDVHVLSNRTQKQAEALLSTLRGQGACISYLRAKDGEVVFREPAPVIPVGRLLARRRAAAGFALALAACAPHSPAEPIEGEMSMQPSPETAPIPAPPTAAIADIPASPPTATIADIPASPPAAAIAEPCPAPITAAETPAPRKRGPARKAATRRRKDLEIVEVGFF